MTGTVSVVIPVRNGAAHVERCLRSLLAQAWPRERVEIRVVDCGSTDASVEICRRLGVTPVSEPDPRPGAARNRGLAAATGEIVAFTAAECEVPPDWVERLVTGLDGASAVQGPIGPAAAAGRFARASGVIRATELAGWGRLAREGTLDRLDAGNCGVWRKVAVEAGGFRPEIHPADDRELGARIAAGGGRIRFDESLRISRRYEESLFRNLRLARDLGRAWAALPRLVEVETLERHFPDVISLLTDSARLAARAGGRRRLALRLWAHAGAAAARPDFESALRHFEEAGRLAIRLGILDTGTFHGLSGFTPPALA